MLHYKYKMGLGVKQVFNKRNMIGIKSGINTIGRFGMKSGVIEQALAPIALMAGQPEIAGGLEAVGKASQKIGKGLSAI